MVRRLAIIGLLALSLMAQRSDTIYYSAGTFQTSTVVTLPAFASIGQPFHMLTAIWSDKSGHTCTNVQNTGTFVPPTLEILAGYSLDVQQTYAITNTARSPQATNAGLATDRWRRIVSATGAFPYVQLWVDNWNTTDCQVSLFYSGGLAALDIRKYADFTTTTADRLMETAFTAGGDIVCPGHVNATCTVYGLILTNSGGATATVTITDTRNNATTATVAIFDIAAGGSIEIPNSNYPIIASSFGGQLTATGAAGVHGFILNRGQ